MCVTCLCFALLLVIGLTANAQQLPPRFRKDVFPIWGWWGPNKEQVTAKVYKDMANAGLTISQGHPNWATELGSRAGLDLIVYDTRIPKAERAATDAECDALVDAIAAEQAGRKSVIGFCVRDEPRPPEFPRLARMVARFKEKAPGCYPYINLLPIAGSLDWIENPSHYEEGYLKQFIKEVKPPVLCTNHYPLIYDAQEREYYFEDLAIIRRVTLEAGIPFWGLVPVTAHGGVRSPTEAELRYQIYAHLIYGAKGIGYFCYWQPPADEANSFAFVGGVVDREGKPTEYYPIVQRINKRVQAMGRTLLKLRSTGVYCSGDVPRGCYALPDDAPLRPKEGWVSPLRQRFWLGAGKLAFGCFDDDKGQRWVMVLNRDYSHNLHTRMSVAEGIKAIDEVAAPESPGIPDRLTIDGDRTITLYIHAGEGRLFKLVRD